MKRPPAVTEPDVPEAFTGRQARDIASISSDHFWLDGRNRLITWALNQYGGDANTMLDAGCGTGHVLGALAQWRPDLRLTGVEASVDSLRLASLAAPRAELIHGDVRQLPFAAEFDVAGVFDVLEHLADDGAALTSVAKTVRPGGLVVITVPQHPRLWSQIDQYSGHQRRYTRAALVGLVRRVGLSVVHVTSFVTLLLPGMVLSRLLGWHGEARPTWEFDISGRVNWLCRGAMRAELGLIRAGVSLPCGGSLMLVARVPDVSAVPNQEVQPHNRRVIGSGR